jgi:hypothetical protein
METEGILLGATVPIILGLIGLVGVLLRRNGRNDKKTQDAESQCPYGLGNPSLALQPIHEALGRIEETMGDVSDEVKASRIILEERLPKRGG